MHKSHALLVVDLQNDFCPGGKLAVPHGDQIIPVINQLMPYFETVILTQDWHPPHHISFASAHPDCHAYQEIEAPYGTQILWPDHCIQGTEGAQFHPELNLQAAHCIIRKGHHPHIDSYSSFFANDHSTPTGLVGYAHELGIDHFYVTGLATDYCVMWSVLDGLKCGFKMTVIEDAVCGIDIDGSVKRAWQKMKTAGAGTVSASTIYKGSPIFAVERNALK